MAGIATARRLTIDALSAFSHAYVPVIHPIESAFVRKGQPPDSATNLIKSLSFDTKSCVKYLSVHIGHVSVTAAFAAPLGKPFVAESLLRICNCAVQRSALC